MPKTQREKEALAFAMGHLIIEAGIAPGIDTHCRCEDCRMVAQSMADAGYLDSVSDRWWEQNG